MYSVCKLNKQGVSIQPWHTPFPILNQFIVPCLVLTVGSWPAYRFLRRQVRWSGIAISFKNFPQCVWSTQSDFSINEVEVNVLLKFLCFFCDPTDVGSLISGFSAFSQSSLYIWEFTVHILLEPTLENFEHYFASMWNDCSCAVVWPFFGTALLLIGMKINLLGEGNGNPLQYSCLGNSLDRGTWWATVNMSDWALTQRA